ncbi:hypothetical protein G9444_2456 [Rhodococcus erythropolis]|uniref:DUF4355 domain-containing protein n=1 Tax=Rhodococcus erythropolis TaxID=1833 RepID=A0A6G9CSB5_RHOER|nr:hypothetical protein [Rhodococcus erythropolis]QIP39700.1 hypothetical protein G9444_2456 [Rhodococcus erythropolis]
MPEENTTETSNETTAPATTETAAATATETGKPEELGEGGKKALDAERAARKEAEKKLSDIEKAQEKDRLAKLEGTQRAEAERDAEKTRAEAAEAKAAVYEAAMEHGITDKKDLALLSKLPADQVAEVAKRLAEAKPAAAGKSGNPVGGAAAAAPIEQQIKEAQARGDFTTVIALKQRQHATN